MGRSLPHPTPHRNDRSQELMEVFARYGTPLRLLSDKGAEFESAVIAELCRCTKIEKIRTSGYQPSTNGESRDSIAP